MAHRGDPRLSFAVHAPWLPTLLAAAGWTEMTSVLEIVPQRPDHGSQTASGRKSMDGDSPSPAAPDSHLHELSTVPGSLAVSHAHPSDRSPEWLDHTPPAGNNENTARAKRPVDRRGGNSCLRLIRQRRPACSFYCGAGAPPPPVERRADTGTQAQHVAVSASNAPPCASTVKILRMQCSMPGR
jgi:hypothetical protein